MCGRDHETAGADAVACGADGEDLVRREVGDFALLLRVARVAVEDYAVDPAGKC